MWDLLKRFLRIKLEKKLDKYENEQKQPETAPPQKEDPRPVNVQIAVKNYEKRQPSRPNIPDGVVLKKDWTFDDGLVRIFAPEKLPKLRLNDGQGGIRILSKSHGGLGKFNKKAVVLLPSGFSHEATVYFTNNKHKVVGQYVNHTNYEDTREGRFLRPHFRFTETGKEIARKLGNKVTLVVKDRGAVRKVTIPNIRKSTH